MIRSEFKKGWFGFMTKLIKFDNNNSQMLPCYQSTILNFSGGGCLMNYEWLYLAGGVCDNNDVLSPLLLTEECQWWIFQKSSSFL